MTDKKPTITVVTVCYNCKDKIGDTIESVLKQDYKDLLYIIIDGNSDDGTKDIIKEYVKRIVEFNIPILPIYEPDKGIYDAMNKALKEAIGYVIFMNAGDSFLHNDTISRCILYLQENPTVAYGSILKKRRITDFYKEEPHPFFKQERKLKSPGICHQATFVKAEVLNEIKFDLRYEIAADFKLLRVLYDRGETFVEIPEIIAVYDTSGVSTVNYRKRLREFAEISGLNPNSFEVKMEIFLYPFKRFIHIIIDSYNNFILGFKEDNSPKKC